MSLRTDAATPSRVGSYRIEDRLGAGDRWHSRVRNERAQQPRERNPISRAQAFQGLLVRAGDRRVHLLEQRLSRRGDPTEMLTPIPGAALPANQAFLLEAVEHPPFARRFRFLAALERDCAARCVSTDGRQQLPRFV